MIVFYCYYSGTETADRNSATSATHFPYSSRENRGDGDRDCSNRSENGFNDCDCEWLVACWLNLETMSRKDMVPWSTPMSFARAYTYSVRRTPVLCERSTDGIDVFKRKRAAKEFRAKSSPAIRENPRGLRCVSIYLFFLSLFLRQRHVTLRNATRAGAYTDLHVRRGEKHARYGFPRPRPRCSRSVLRAPSAPHSNRATAYNPVPDDPCPPRCTDRVRDTIVKHVCLFLHAHTRVHIRTHVVPEGEREKKTSRARAARFEMKICARCTMCNITHGYNRGRKLYVRNGFGHMQNVNNNMVSAIHTTVVIVRGARFFFFFFLSTTPRSSYSRYFNPKF